MTARAPRRHSLEVEGEQHARALAELKLRYPRLANDDLDDDDRRAMADTLEGMTCLGEAVDAVVEAIRDDEQWAKEAIPARIRTLQARKSRLLDRAAGHRERLLHVLASCGVVTERDPSYRRDGYTLTAPRPRRELVIDCDRLPPHLMAGRPPVVDMDAVLADHAAGTLPERYLRAALPEPDEDAIAAEIDAGRDVPGVEVIWRRPSIQIRS